MNCRCRGVMREREPSSDLKVWYPDVKVYQCLVCREYRVFSNDMTLDREARDWPEPPCECGARMERDCHSGRGCPMHPEPPDERYPSAEERWWLGY